MTTATQVSNSQSIMDSRDLIARLAELESEHATLEKAIDKAATDAERTAAQTEIADWDEDWNYTSLKNFCAKGEQDVGKWADGVTLINDDYFTEYAEEEAQDIGAIDCKVTWPLNHIDWEAAAEQLKYDYSRIDWDGVT